MKLLACHIENFGKLSNLSVEFSDGINVINESNAWGKSTLAAFLKVMFYGLDAKKDPKAFDKERNIYRPWQGGSFGGEVDFQVGEKRYRISRSFGRTEKTDEFYLYDLSTNLESEDFSEDIGVELFELDSASFKRSIYIAQNDCASATSDSINAKLGNLAENTDDINNFEVASGRMKALLLQLTPDRVTGSIKKRKASILQLEQDIRAFESAQEGLNGVKAMEQTARERIEEMQQIRRDYAAALVIASEDSRRKELYTQYEALCEDVNEKEARVNGYKSFFPKEVPTNAEFEEQMRYVLQLEETKSTIRSQSFTQTEQEEWNKLTNMFEAEKPRDEEIDAAIQMLGEIDRQREEIARQEPILVMYADELDREIPQPHFSNANKACLGFGVGTLTAGGAAALIGYFNLLPDLNAYMLLIVGSAILGIGALLTVVGAVLTGKKKKAIAKWKQETDENREDLQKRYDALDGVIKSIKEDVKQVQQTIGEFLGKYHIYCEEKEYQPQLYDLKNQLHTYERLEGRQTAKLREEGNSTRLQTYVHTFAQNYELNLGEDMAAGLNLLYSKAAECRLAQNAYEESVAKKDAFEKRQDKTFWTKEMRCPYTVEELNHMIEEADKNIEALKGTRNQYIKQLEELEEQLDLRDEKVQELKEQQAQQEKDIRSYQLLSVTHDLLQKAKEQLTARYMEPIAKGFAKYYQMLTKDDRGEWLIDANINLKVREYGELRETKWLSAGYQDLIGVCMRLALVDAMYQEEKPFLILDDPFVNLDEEKVVCGNELLLSVANEYQVIYFTCHDSRSPL